MVSYIFIGAHSAICQRLIAEIGPDCRLFLLSREASRLPADQRERHHCYSLDPKDLAAMIACFETIMAIQGPHSVDGVVNFPGSLLLKPAHMTTEKEWQATLDINLTTAFNAVHATAKVIKQNCSVVLLSTAAASLGLPNHEAIAAAKAGVEGLARSAAASYAKQNLRFNVVAPGLVTTELTQPILKSTKGAALSQSLHGLQRFGKPENIASAIKWLLDPLNDWTTGAVFQVDGGLATTKTYQTIT